MSHVITIPCRECASSPVAGLASTRHHFYLPIWLAHCSRPRPLENSERTKRCARALLGALASVTSTSAVGAPPGASPRTAAPADAPPADAPPAKATTEALEEGAEAATPPSPGGCIGTPEREGEYCPSDGDDCGLVTRGQLGRTDGPTDARGGQLLRPIG